MPITERPRADWPLAIALAVLAGFVDAVGFLRIGGLFVSFMSGNSTLLGIDLVNRNAQALMIVALILGFLSGVMVAAILGERLGKWSPMGMILFCTALLAWSALLMVEGPGAVLLAAAMGALNVVFQRGGGVSMSIPITYVTGTLVRLGQALAGALLGIAPAAGWVPYLLLWSGLVLGALGGTYAYDALGTDALWGAASFAFALAVAAAGRGLSQR
ncbi:MAG: YoaK family protein [Sphingomonas phyllosphaerae]